ncbi:MAG: hypothetical protein O3A27_06040 [Actinomycetota bacterium]|nr:hypothetical protein [Actinomycetota bacterium]
MSSSLKYAYIGHFMPEDSEELVSIVRTTDFNQYEYWNETLGLWRKLHNDSFGQRQIHIHDTMLKESWAKVVFPNAFM